MSSISTPTEKLLLSRREDLAKIASALDSAAALARSFAPEARGLEFKNGDDPVTAVDKAVNELLLQALPLPDEGWLSEETADDSRRLTQRRVWVVDPLDGTREFVAGIPEWCISIGLVEEGRAVAGGICNPATREVFVGSLETGIAVKGRGMFTRHPDRPLVLASRTECARGEWDRFREAPFQVRPLGSVAYKLACVAAGWADATWTLVPKHEWDVAAGAALVAAGGGEVKTLDGLTPEFNRPQPRFRGLVAFSAHSSEWLKERWAGLKSESRWVEDP